VKDHGLHFSGLPIGLDHTMPEIIAHAARTHGARPFCIGEDGSVTSFADLEGRVAGLAARLIRLGVGYGERAAIWAPNSCEWIVAACAIECIGAIMVPINTRFKGAEALYVLEKTRAPVLFTVTEFLGNDFTAMLRGSGGGQDAGQGSSRPVADLPHLRTILMLDEPGFAQADVSEADWAAYREASARVTPQTTADILFTSGTTGRPKGAMHSHGQALWMAGMVNWSNDLRATDRSAIVNPFFHSFGYRAGWVSALCAGITIWPLAMFDAGAMLQLIEREAITQLSGAPAVFHSLMEHPDFATRDISSLRTGHTGGAKTPPEIIRAGYEKLGFDIFLTSFGQTEATAMISTNWPGDPLDAIVRTVGLPIPHQEIRIIDPEGGDVAPGESGELLVRGANVMQGYFEEPEQTAATIDTDGWLHTGDVACLEPDGRLRILDRLKDVVIVGGFNAYPVEIEMMLSDHPAIAEVAVIGLPDTRMGEVTAACVVLKDGCTLDLDQLTQWCRDRMANYKVPRHLIIKAEFPRTPLGKVQKFVLRDEALASLTKA
jgi:acyl-CoA synthetase (AMP-forming)/AMP-acid ligase II